MTDPTNFPRRSRRTGGADVSEPAFGSPAYGCRSGQAVTRWPAAMARSSRDAGSMTLEQPIITAGIVVMAVVMAIASPTPLLVTGFTSAISLWWPL